MTSAGPQIIQETNITTEGGDGSLSTCKSLVTYLRFHQNENLLKFSRRRRLDDVLTTSKILLPPVVVVPFRCRCLRSLVALDDDNFCEFHVSYACISDACAVEPRRRFVTEHRKKRKKESQNLNPGYSAWVTRGLEALTRMLFFF